MAEGLPIPPWACAQIAECLEDPRWSGQIALNVKDGRVVEVEAKRSMRAAGRAPAPEKEQEQS